MLPLFTLKLNHKLVPGLVTMGVFDGTYPCLTAATSGDKVWGIDHDQEGSWMHLVIQNIYFSWLQLIA